METNNYHKTRSKQQQKDFTLSYLLSLFQASMAVGSQMSHPLSSVLPAYPSVSQTFLQIWKWKITL